MKKNFLVVLLVLMFSGFMMTACNSKATLTAEFGKEEYAISIDEVVNFYDEIKVKGFEKDDVVLSSSKEDVLSPVSNFEFKGLTSGSAVLFASFNDKTVAQVKVDVKYRLAAPSNVKVDDEGRVSWDKSFVVKSGVKYEAELYSVVYKLADAETDTKLDTNENFFYLPAGSKGRYEIKIIASSSNETIDASLENTYFVNYGIMEQASNIIYIPAEDFSQNAEFTWDVIENASYDIRINGVKLGKNLTDSKFKYDFSKYKVGQDIKLEIVVKDDLKIKEDSTVALNLHILDAPTLRYNFDDESYLDCDFDERAGGYRLSAENIVTGEIETRTYYSQEEFKETLAGLKDGVYGVTLIAVGGISDGDYYINSKTEDAELVAKLKTPEVDVKFVGKNLKLTFESDGYINRYMVSIGEKKEIYETKNGLVATFDLSDLEVGNYVLKVKALPALDSSSENGVKTFVGNKETNLVLDSDEFVFDFLVLPEVGQISHRLTDKSSTFVFEEVANANFYELFINKQKVETECVYQSGFVYLTVDNLSDYVPVNSKYEVVVEAGLKTDGEEHSIRSTGTKTLNLLSLASIPQTQTNGSFEWNRLNEDCLYYYEIYNPSNDKFVLNGLTPIYSNTLAENKIVETLEEGYYTIKIASISTNTDLYLDSNFSNQDNVRLVNFIVTKDIEMPTATFRVEDEKYILTINTVDKGGEYKVLVNGEIDGSYLLTETKDSFEYDLKDTLYNEQTHNISIIASSGKFDGNLYLDSVPFEINVTRLARADYEVEALYSIFDELTGFRIDVKRQTGARRTIFKCDSEDVEGEEFALNMTDGRRYGNEFTIEMIVVAGESRGNDYYIDSHRQIVEFERVAAPSMMKYEDGIISWNYDDERAEDFYISLTLISSRGNNLTTCFFAGSLDKQYDIQNKINTLREEDINFDTAYRQAESVEIEIVAFKNGVVDKKYVLASAKGTTVTGENAIVRTQLERLELSFDPDERVINWTREGENTVYDIYLDGEIYLQDWDENSLEITDRLSEFARQREIKVQAKNPAYLESDLSQPIKIKQLAMPSIISIDKVGDDFIASFDIVSDTAYVSGIMINGTTDNSLINYTLGGNTVNFKLKDFDSDLKIVIKAKNESATNYYVDSNEISISMTDFAGCEFEASTQADRVSWTEMGVDFNGNNIDPITYRLEVVDASGNYSFELKGQSSILLDEIEERIKTGLNGNVSVKVYAYIDSHYILDVSQSGLVGYYGRTIEATSQTEKLKKVNEFRVEIVEEENASVSQTSIEKTSNSSLKIKFDDLWADFDNIFLNIEVAGEKLASIPANGIDLLLYRLSREGGEYTLYISNAIIAPLAAGEINVSVYATRANSITSDKAEFTVRKFDTVKNTVVYDEGVLQINDSQEAAAYKVEISIEDISITKVLAGEKSLNLLTEELFLGRYGDYTIRLIAVDEEGKIIPSSQIATVKGYKLKGIESISIDDYGNINVNLYPDDFNNIEFLAKHNENEKLIELERKEGSDTYYTSMVDALRLFDRNFEQTGNQSFDFLVRKKGSINSDYVNFEFEFTREAKPQVLTRNGDLDKDYILFDVDDKTRSVRVAFSVTEMTEEGQIVREEIQHYMLNDIEGFWKTDKNGENGCFVREKGAEGSDTEFIYTRKYAVCVNDILAGRFGQFSIEVARVGSDGSKAYQFKPEVYDLYKINPVDEDATRAKIDNNILRFEWILEDMNCPDPTIKPSSYMIYFKDADNNVVEKVVTYTSSFDVRKTTKLLTKTQYKVYIVALNSSSTIIASDEATNDTLSLLIFPEPATLEVKNGRLIFNEEEFKNSDFINDIKTFFQTPDSVSGEANKEYYTMIGEKTYYEPYYFTPGTLSDFNVTLKFRKMLDGKETDEVYNIDVLAFNLFPDVIIDNVLRNGYDTVEGKASYFDLLKMYRTRIENNPSADATRRMITSLNTAARGIGDFYYTLDDVFKAVPAGDYSVSIAQSTIDSYIESASSACVRMYVSPAPEVVLNGETFTYVETQKTYYNVNVKTANTMIPTADGYSQGIAQRYKLQLSEEGVDVNGDKKPTIDFIIYYDENEETYDENGNVTKGAWIIDYGEYTDLKFSNRFTGGKQVRVITTVDGNLEFKINMSELKNAVNTAAGKEIVKINVDYEADLFVYYQDNDKLLNGKSGLFNVKYLDLKPEDIIFRNGVLSVNGKSGYELLMKYQWSQEAQERTSILTFGDSTMTNIELDRAGKYNYIKLSINGSVTRRSLNIESAVYMIENVYKLSAPTIETADGSLSIGYASGDMITTGELSFNMGNNESLDSKYEGEDKGYYYSTKFIGEVPLYRVGSLSNDGKNVRYPSELTANEYFAYLNGNDGSFIHEEDKSNQVDYLLKFDNGLSPILSSSQTSIKAKMLGNVKAFSIEKGDIKISDDQMQYEVLDSDDKEGHVLYEVLIDYYYISYDEYNNAVYELAYSETIYSERLNLAEQYISGLAINVRYDYYKFSVSLVGAKKLDKQTAGFGIVHTVEDTYFQIYEHLVFNDENAGTANETFVLRGLVNNEFVGYVNRTTSPRLDNNTDVVKNGKVNFIIDDSVYYAEAGSTNIVADSAERIKVYADYEVDSKKLTTIITGQYTFSVDSSSEGSKNIYVSFLPDEGQLNETIKSFVLKVYAYGKDSNGRNAIISAPLTINEVFKLPNLNDNYYDIVLKDGKTAIDFAKYFENVSIQDNKSCYAVVATAIMPNGNNESEKFTLDSNKIFYIPNGATSIEIQVRDNQSDNEMNAKKLLPSDTLIMETQSTTVEDLEISWNNILKRFEWNWPEDNNNLYDYVVTVSVNGFDEVAVVNGNFYCPRACSGVIKENGFSIKARLVDEEGGKLSIYSEDKVFESPSIQYNLFSDGEGTKENPYKLKTVEDFKNMSLRNTGDYYFEIAQNITIKISELVAEDGISHLFDVFNAKLNGRGRGVTIVSDFAFGMDEYSFDIVSQVKLISNYYSSLFKTVSASGSVTNMNIAYQIENLDVSNKNIMFAPVCLFNYGTVENINVSAFTLSIKAQTSSATRAVAGIAVGGLVSVNYGTINDCTNNATFNFTAPQMIEITFTYAGIATYNANAEGSVGTISSCFNKKDKTVELSVTNSKVYMAGITLTNMGNISLCGNDSNFSVSDTSNSISANAHFAGIAIANKNGSLEYLYNNGKFETKSNMIKLFSGGVIYQVEGGSIQTLVETRSRQAVVKVVSTMPTDFGGHYAGNNSGTAQSIRPSELAEMDIECVDGKIIKILLNDGEFVASIAQKRG